MNVSRETIRTHYVHSGVDRLGLVLVGRMKV